MSYVANKGYDEAAPREDGRDVTRKVWGYLPYEKRRVWGYVPHGWQAAEPGLRIEEEGGPGYHGWHVAQTGMHVTSRPSTPLFDGYWNPAQGHTHAIGTDGRPQTFARYDPTPTERLGVALGEEYDRAYRALAEADLGQTIRAAAFELLGQAFDAAVAAVEARRCS